VSGPAAEGRDLGSCEAVILIVYSLPPDAIERGYEGWLGKEDNPFFNAIPGIHHYANWRVERTLGGEPPSWSHFDFLGMRRREDLEQAWFSPELDAFRRGWLKKWGYRSASVSELLGHAYLMQRVATPPGVSRTAETFSLGRGDGPADAAWRVTHAVRKHYVAAMAERTGPWLIPAAASNPLGFTWMTPGEATGADLVLATSRIAGPDAP
jgi:hypothetical protein